MRALRWLRTAVAIACVVALWVGPVAADTGTATMASAADGAVAGFSGSAGVVIADPLTGAAYEHDGSRVFTAASLYKLGVMVEAYRQAAAGVIALDKTTVTVVDEDLVDDGVESDSGTTFSVRDAIERMITVSDNSCAHALLRLLDTHNVNATVRAFGLTDTRINATLPEDERTGDTNTTSARDMARLFNGLVRGSIVDPGSSAEMLGILGRQQINDRLPSRLPAGTPVAHKTGNLDAIAHDVGVITTPFGPRVVIVLTSDFADYADVIALSGAIAADAFSLPLDRFAGDITPVQLSQIVPGEAYAATMKVRNDSTFSWDSTFHLAAHWRDGSGTYTRWDGARATLPPLAPGESAIVQFQGVAPANVADFEILELDVVHEGVAWAGTPARIPVAFRPQPRPRAMGAETSPQF